MGIFQKILNKDQSNNVYKERYDKAQEDLKKKDKKIKSLQKENKHLKNERDKLYNKYARDYLFFDFEGILSKFYVSPLIEYPFSSEDKRCFAFMDHLAKYLTKNIDENDQPLVSIILPVFNNESELLNTINSVLNQTYDNYELIIVDDASDDKTHEILNSLDSSNIQICLNNKQMGFSYCRNLALNKSKGQYIFYIDAGNTWCEEYLKTMMGAFMEVPDAEAIYSGQLAYTQDWNKISEVRFGVYNKSLLHNRNYISLSAFAHKKSIANKMKFEESLNSLEDWHFILKISDNYKMYSVPVLQSKTNIDTKEDKNTIDLVHKLTETKNDFSLKHELTKKISIVIPSYELLDDLKECIDTILSFNSPLIDIIVVDNDSNDKVKEYLNSIYLESKIKLIQNKINYGFTYAVEQGISISDENSDILLLNNDAILTKGSLEAMQYYAYEIDDCAIMVPQEVLFDGDQRIEYNVPFADVNFECDVTPSKIHKNIINVPVFHDGNIMELSFAPFFCTYIKREIYDKSLGLDPELGRHYRSDRIFSNFVRHVLGLKIYWTCDAKVYHKSQQATKKLKKKKDEYDMIFNKNQWEPELAEKLGYKTPLWDK